MLSTLPGIRGARQNGGAAEMRAACLGASQQSFMVGQDRHGRWIAKESHGLGGGIFVSSRAAINYAESETSHRPGAVRVVSLPLELEM